MYEKTGARKKPIPKGAMYPSDEEDVVSCSLRMEEELAELRRNTVRMKVLLYGMLLYGSGRFNMS